jgi:hypothetical protein
MQTDTKFWLWYLKGDHRQDVNMYWEVILIMGGGRVVTLAVYTICQQLHRHMLAPSKERKRSWANGDVIQSCVQRHWGKHQRFRVRVTGVPAEAETQNLLNTDITYTLTWSVIRYKGWMFGHWINLAQHKDLWRPLVHTLLNLGFP